MNISKENIDNFYFKENHLPIIRCPYCKSGNLQVKKNSLVEIQTEFSKNEFIHHDYWNYHSKFNCILICNSSSCNETVFVTGVGAMEPEIYYYEGTGETRYDVHFIPLFFQPAIEIFPIKGCYPKTIQIYLLKSFKLFFVDSESCVNKIRIILEELMNLSRIVRYSIRKNKRHRLSLHERINLFVKKNEKNKEVGSYLLAIKWIGNHGTHNEK